MKINHQFIKDLLIAFEDTEGPDTFIYELEEKGFKRDDQELIFHMRLLADNQLITRVDGEKGFGHQLRNYMQGSGYFWIETPLRLTASGHDFIANLRQAEVWQTVKTNFKDEGISTLVEITKSLAAGFAKKKIKALTDIDL